MSEASEAAQLTLLMADFVNVDAAGKVNVVGGGINILGVQPSPQVPLMSHGFFVFGRVEIPTRLCPVEAVVELALLDAAGEVVTPQGADRALRIAQVTTFSRAMIGNEIGPPELRTSHQTIVGFGDGLPASLGSPLQWSLRVDGDDANATQLQFVILTPPHNPVIG